MYYNNHLMDWKNCTTKRLNGLPNITKRVRIRTKSMTMIWSTILAE